MKVSVLFAIAAVTAFASTETIQVQVNRAQNHLNNIVQTFPPSVGLVQLHAQMLQTPISQGLDELATLLIKMQKDISAAKVRATAENVRVQGECDRKRKYHITRRNQYTTYARKYWATYLKYKKLRESVPQEIRGLKIDIGKLHGEIRVNDDTIRQGEKASVEARQLYLQNMADFNKALDDVDMLRTLVETKLANRGQGSDNDVRHTMNPTIKGKIATYSPTKKGEVFKGHKAHEFVERSTKFVEVASNSEIASMSNEEATEAMKAIYANLKGSVHSNPMVLALVDTLDSVLVQVQGGEAAAVDKIRALLTEVRNELQKNKRILTKAEIERINSFQQFLLTKWAIRSDLEIDIANKHIEVSEFWQTYGSYWRTEGGQRRLYHYWDMRSKYETQVIVYHNELCTNMRNKYIIADKKRVRQLGQIKKALEILVKLKNHISAKTFPKVNATIDEVTINMCRQFTAESKWISVARSYSFGNTAKTYAYPNGKDDFIYKETPKAALDIYKDKDAANKPYACIAKWKFTYTCTAGCDIRLNDNRLPLDGFSKSTTYPINAWRRVAQYTKNTEFNHRQVSEIRLGKPNKYNPQHRAFRDLVYKYAGKNSVVRHNIEVFVVPGCNCDPKVNKDYIVDPNWKV